MALGLKEATRKLLDPGSYLGWALIAIFTLVGVYFWAGKISSNYPSLLMDIMMFVGIALSLAVIMSFAGYVSFGHAVFFGLGGFSVTIVFRSATKGGILAGVTSNSVVLLVLGLLLGIALSILLAATVGAAVLRLRGAFFAIATIGMDYVILYLETLVGEGGELEFNPGYTNFLEKTYAFFLIGFILTFLIVYLVRVSKFGYGLAAIREDEDAAEILGVDTTRYKIYAFIIAAALAALWGGLFSWRTSSVGPENFSLKYSVDMIVMNVIGGLGTLAGPIIGGIIYYIVKRLTLIYVPQLAYVVMGVIVILVVSFFPEGIVGIVNRKVKKLSEYLI
ncbi:MAG: branched-chain amino acid ABC transporter permease [Desulfurococcales archaeon]|nr:branched-chain amino acid ABC transporter permease [Desulfurococcales archaeon]